METTERTIHELPIIMRDNFDEYFEMGLCWLNIHLFGAHLYSYEEYDKMKRYIREYRPNKKNSWSWEAGQFEPRKKWIDKQIKLTKPK